MTRRTRFSLVAALLAAGAAATLLYLHRTPPYRPEISESIARAVRTGGDSVIVLSDHAPMPWTDVFVFPPYSHQDMAEATMGARWPGRWSAIDVRDHLALLVFLDSGRVVAAIEHPRVAGDFVSVPAPIHLTRANARFLVDRLDSVWTVLRPHPAPR